MYREDQALTDVKTWDPETKIGETPSKRQHGISSIAKAMKIQQRASSNLHIAGSVPGYHKGN
jgi:hypothetical protein